MDKNKRLNVLQWLLRFAAFALVVIVAAFLYWRFSVIPAVQISCAKHHCVSLLPRTTTCKDPDVFDCDAPDVIVTTLER